MMNEQENKLPQEETEAPVEQAQPAAPEEAAPESAGPIPADKPKKAARYTHRTANTLYRLHIGGLVVTAVYLLSQLILTLSSYFTQKSQLDLMIALGQTNQSMSSLNLSLFYSLIGMVLPLVCLVAVCFLFLFVGTEKAPGAKAPGAFGFHQVSVSSGSSSSSGAGTKWSSSQPSSSCQICSRPCSPSTSWRAPS